jgi:hypothetical protein
MTDYDTILKAKLGAVVSTTRDAEEALKEAAKYWREVYSVQVPNAENQLVPGTLIGVVDDIAIRLARLVELVSVKL